MAVQIVTHEYRPYRGGIACYVEELARACAEGGVVTEVWAPGYGERGWQREGAVAVYRVAMRGRQDWWSRMRMRAALRRERSAGMGTVVLAEPGPIRLWMGAWAAGLPEAQRVVLILHGSEVRAFSRGSDRVRFERLLRRVARVGVVSAAVEEVLRDSFPNMETPVVQVPGAVRAAWQPLSAEERPRLEGPLRMLQVGRVHPRKGHDLTVEALRLLEREERGQIEVRCVGPTTKQRGYGRSLRARVERESLPVHFTGALGDAELLESYRWADLALFPSRDAGNSMEGLGLAALEAAHFGLPVIATRVGGIPEAVVDGQTGRLVAPNAPALAAAIREALANRAAYQSLGQQGAARVRTSFSWARNAQKLGLLDGISGP